MIESVPAELWRDGQLVARGMCHLLWGDAGPQGGTVSRLEWLQGESDLDGLAIELRLKDSRRFSVRITRHSHPEGRTVLRFVPQQPVALS